MDVSQELLRDLKRTLTGLETDRQPFWQHWRDIADYFMPKRYVWLQSAQERLSRIARNPLILDPTGTNAGKTLASGMMNGITSPSRPWLRLRAPAFDQENDVDVRLWLDEVARRILLAMAETNFYNSMAIVYVDLAFFGTAANLIYEDYEDVFRCYNCALGEYYLAQDDRLVVNTFAREFTFKVHQVVKWFGIENVSNNVKESYENGGNRWMNDVELAHLIQPNKGPLKIHGDYKYVEFYWERSSSEQKVLKKSGFNELPGIFPRWEITANDSYGMSPAMDALPDVIQLQHETKKKGQGLDKLIDPPILADIQLQHKPTALLPRGITYVAGVNNVGVKPIYTIQLPLDQLTADIREVQARINETFYNDLFKMISQLDTVRSATEIDARREEKLVLLGPVLERFENEALDPAIRRIFNIMDRAGLLPEAPERLKGADVEIQYMSVLTAAQTAVATIPTERWIGLIGSIAGAVPQVLNIPDWDELIRDYGKDLGVKAKAMKTPDQVAAINDAQAKQQQAQQALATAGAATEGAKTLSETDVGGGSNALQKLINPYG